MDKQEALAIIVEASLKHTNLGWDEVNKLTDFQGRIMRRPGGTYNNFVEALVPLGLTRENARDAFVDARRDLRSSKEEKKGAARPAKPQSAAQPVPEARRAAPGTVVCPRPDVPPPERDHRPAPACPPELQRVDASKPGTGNDTGPGSGRTLRGVAPGQSPGSPPRPEPAKSAAVKRKPAAAEPEAKQPTLF